MKLRLISHKQVKEEKERERERTRIAAMRMKFMGRLLTAVRDARDYMRNNPPMTGSTHMSEWDSYRDTMSELNSILDRDDYCS